MPRRVAIVGLGMTDYVSRHEDKAYYELVFEAARKALDDASIQRGDVDTVVESGWDIVDGRTISNMYVGPASGGYLKDESKVAEDGIFAAAYAYMRIASGVFDVALVTGHGHAEAPLVLASHLCFDPLFLRPIGLSYIAALALQATRYANDHGASEEDAANIVVKSRAAGVKNHRAHIRGAVSVDDVLRSKYVAWPLKELDLPPLTSGAVALVLAGEEIARRISKEPVWIEGVAWASESYQLGARSLSGWNSLKLAAERAYRASGVVQPLKQLGVAELHSTTSFHEMMAYEALGLCEPGGGAKLAHEGMASLKGQVPVNPSGGVLCCNPFGGAGLLRLVEAALQLRGSAGEIQISDVETTLAHGSSAFTGPAGQEDCVFILRR